MSSHIFLIAKKSLQYYWALYIGLILFGFSGLWLTIIQQKPTQGFIDIIRDLTLAILTILIPFALAILSQILSNKDDGKKEFNVLDLHVVIDNVFRLKWLLLSVFISFFSLLLMKEVDFYPLEKISNIALFNLWMLYTGYIVLIITDCYSWVKGEVWGYRFDYLEKNATGDDSIEIWKSMLSAKNIDYQHETVLLRIYETTIDKTLESDLSKTNALLGLMYSYLNNRNAHLLIKILPKILEWHFKVSLKVNDNDTDNNSLVSYFDCQDSLTKIIQTLQSKHTNAPSSSIFFKKVKKHIDQYKSDNQQYTQQILTEIFNQLIEDLEAKNASISLWKNFPKEWKITSETLSPSNEAHILFNLFIPWAIEQFYQSNSFGKILANVSRNLFPDTEPSTWSSLLIVFFVDNLQEAVKTPLGFGGMGRPYSNLAEIDSAPGISHQELRNNTYKLALWIQRFSNTETLTNDIKTLNEMGELEDQSDERRRIRLIHIFNDILLLINESE